MFNINVCQCLDSNYGYLESEATTLPTEPQSLPLLSTYFVTYYEHISLTCLEKDQ